MCNLQGALYGKSVLPMRFARERSAFRYMCEKRALIQLSCRLFACNTQMSTILQFHRGLVYQPATGPVAAAPTIWRFHLYSVPERDSFWSIQGNNASFPSQFCC